MNPQMVFLELSADELQGVFEVLVGSVTDALQEVRGIFREFLVRIIREF